MGRYKARPSFREFVLLEPLAPTCGVGPLVTDLIERLEFIYQELGSVSTTIPRNA